MADRSGYIGRAPGDSAVTVARQNFTPTGVQTNFTFASGYTPGYLDAYLNGVKLVVAQDFTATDGSVVGLTSAAASGDIIELVAFKAFNAASVNNAGTLTVSGNQTNNGTLSVTGGTTLSNLNVTGISTLGTVSSLDLNGGVLTLDADGDTTITADTDDQIDIAFGGNDRITLSTGLIDLKNDGSQSAIRFYCESSNAHYAALQAPAHSAFSGNITLTLPATTDTLVARTTTDTLTNKTLTSPTISTPTLTGGVGIADSIFHTGDDNTQIRFPAADTFTVETAGSERIRVSSTGKFGIGTNNPTKKLHVFDSSATSTTVRDNTVARFLSNASNADCNIQLSNGVDHSAQIGIVGNGAEVYIAQDGVERLRIASDGDVGIGTDNPITAMHILSTNTGGDLTVERDGNGSAGPELVLRHTSTSPDDNDYIGQIIFSGRDDANNNTTVVRIDGVMTDVSNGSEDGELVFNTRNDGTFAERVRIDSAGRILRGVSSSYANASIDDLQIGSNTSSTQRGLTIGSTDECAIAFADAGDTRAGSITYNHGQDALIIKTEGQNTRLTINRAGGVFTGVATATQFDATSDVSLKENIEVIDEPITKLSELKGVTFDWKAGGHSVGVIAQDVEKVLPTAVGGNKDQKTVNYNAIIGLLVESVKDQQKQIEELKSLLDK